MTSMSGMTPVAIVHAETVRPGNLVKAVDDACQSQKNVMRNRDYCFPTSFSGSYKCMTPHI